MKMVGVATASASCEPWVFRGYKKPTLPANIAVSVATKTGIVMRAIKKRGNRLIGSPFNAAYKL